MLRLLLDEHLSPQIAHQVRAHNSAIDIVPLQEWEDGAYLATEDAVILTVAREQNRTLVTRDARTIMPVLKDWGERNIDHGGVLFADHRSFAEGNIGVIVGALLQIWETGTDADWTNVVRYLKP